MPIFLWTAATLEAIIGNFTEMGIIFGIQFVNAGKSYFETLKVWDLDYVFFKHSQQGF